MRTLNRLTDMKCRNAKPGVLSDGGGLLLRTKPSGTRSWLYVWTKGGKRREAGLGAYPSIPLSTARRLAAECRAMVAEGRDPIAERKKEAEPTFGECVTLFLDNMSGQWRSERHRSEWRTTLTQHASLLSSMPVSTIGTEHVLKVLTPLWKRIPESASRLRARIERVLDFAKGKGWRGVDNPARWRGHLKSLLPPARSALSRGHYDAMDYRAVPAFMQKLKEQDGVVARAVELVVLTACRSGEVRGLRWDEIDMAKAIATIPAQRMKKAKEHRVPLSDRAMEIIREMHEVRLSDLVFPGGRNPAKPVSSQSFLALLARMGVNGATAHGFRSSFRDYCGDCLHNYSRETVEHALAHATGNASELAYRRSTSLEKRRALMQVWSDYCNSAASGENVIPLARR